MKENVTLFFKRVSTGLDKNNTLNEDTLYLGTSYCTITDTTARTLTHVSPNKDVNACI